MSKTEAVVIRLARRGDASTVARMSRRLVEYDLPWRWRPGRVLRQINNPEAAVIIAEVDGAPAGFALMSFTLNTAHLSLLAVSDQHRRHRIGSRLLNWLIASCRVAGVSRINLEVRRTNRGAVSFYQHAGFKSLGYHRGYYDGQEDAKLMTLQLVPENFEYRNPDE